MELKNSKEEKKQGYLLKWINMWKGWKKRYFILKDSFLTYKEEPDKAVKGTISLQDAIIKMSVKNELEIVVNYAGVKLKLKTSSIPEKIQWIDWLRQAQTTARKSLLPKIATSGLEEDKKANPFNDVDFKLQEMNVILEERFQEKNNKVLSKLSKIYSIQTCMEDTLKGFIAEVLEVMNKESIKEMAEKLEAYSTQLKEETLDALKFLGQKEDQVIIEKGEFRSQSSDSASLNEEFFDTANEDEISKNLDLTVGEETEYRLGLPAKRSDLNKISVWQVLKDMIGKDLTHFSVPIYFIEPIGMMQRMAECLDYVDLLSKAATTSESLLRLTYVTTFLIAQYSCTYKRTKKPFNPLLGETFEYIGKDYKFFCEQVSHHPPISACHCHSDLYEFWMHTHMKFAFWGKTLEGVPLGSMNIYLKPFKERYVLSRPATAACNVIIGNMYMDNYGETTTVNTKTGEKAKINYHRCGWFGKNYASVTGTICDGNGNEVYNLTGTWIDSVKIKKISTGEETLVWKRHSLPSEWENFYYFPEFTYQLNNLTPSLKAILPPTDSRLRSDQRALENGDIKLAQAEKIRLEEMQRAMRKEREKNKIEHKPIYYIEIVDDMTKENTYMFNWKYWDDRKKGNWSRLPKLFDSK